uniref:Uncharacterized protein n=1 Tax=Arundo donax TaxID=35708 RepID=A0A0A9D2J3_ARUDO
MVSISISFDDDCKEILIILAINRRLPLRTCHFQQMQQQIVVGCSSSEDDTCRSLVLCKIFVIVTVNFYQLMLFPPVASMTTTMTAQLISGRVTFIYCN